MSPTEYRAALEAERKGYAARGLDDRVAAIDAELDKIVDEAEPTVEPDVEVDPAPAAYRAALLAERDGYVARGLDDRVAAIDAELALLPEPDEAKPSRKARRTPAATPVEPKTPAAPAPGPQEANGAPAAATPGKTPRRSGRAAKPVKPAAE